MPSPVASPESASLSASLLKTTKIEPQVACDQPMTAHPPTAEQQSFVERLKRLYKADHQAEILVLQAEVDSLLIELESRKASNRPD
jgi:heme oxygenase